MAERRLKRQLNLPQVLMLGTAGTIAAEIFVLTGHVAGMSGSAGLLALLLVGALNYAFALNYAELATTYPVTGGAMTYVQEAFGSGLRAFLVGSLDSLSSAFYAALSAVGFAYSLRVFLPFVPVVPTALAVTLAFSLLNLFGVARVGRVQVVLGALLLTLLGIYVVGGLTLPHGFSWQVFLPQGKWFIHESFGTNLMMMFATMALIFNAFVGYELIADDAEEVANPSRNIPIALLASLTIITLIYGLVTWVTLGTIPWFELAGSEMALSEAAARFLPGIGPLLIGLAGIIATLTSVNTAMLSATREAFTLGRLGLWPRFMTRLGRLRTPYMAIISIGAVVGLVCVIELVDILSYISSSGYLFVMFWSGLAMIRLRRKYPHIKRPFRVPLFPLTAYVQVGTCVLLVVFTARIALAFGAAVLALLAVAYRLRQPVGRVLARRVKAVQRDRDRIIVAIANPDTADGLVELGAILAGRVIGTTLEILAVNVEQQERLLPRVVGRHVARFEEREHALLRRLSGDLRERNVPYYTRVRAAPAVAQGLLDEIREHDDIKLFIMGWPGLNPPHGLAEHPVTTVLQEAPTDIAVFLNRGVPKIRRILMPFGGGVHSRLALRLAVELAEEEGAEVVVLRCFTGDPHDDDLKQDELALAQESIEIEFGGIPACITTRLACVESVPTGVFAELRSGDYQLVVMGAAVAASLHTGLFGEMTDHLAEAIPCSVLLVRRYEPAAITWVRRRVKEVTEPAVAPSGNHRGQNGGTAYAAEDDGYPKIAIHSQ